MTSALHPLLRPLLRPPLVSAKTNHGSSTRAKINAFAGVNIWTSGRWVRYLERGQMLWHPFSWPRLHRGWQVPSWHCQPPSYRCAYHGKYSYREHGDYGTADQGDEVEWVERWGRVSSVKTFERSSTIKTWTTVRGRRECVRVLVVYHLPVRSIYYDCSSLWVWR